MFQLASLTLNARTFSNFCTNYLTYVPSHSVTGPAWRDVGQINAGRWTLEPTASILTFSKHYHSASPLYARPSFHLQRSIISLILRCLEYSIIATRTVFDVDQRSASFCSDRIEYPSYLETLDFRCRLDCTRATGVAS